MAAAEKKTQGLERIERALLPGSVVVGVVLTLLAATLPDCRQSAAARAEADLKAAEQLHELEAKALSEKPAGEQGEPLKALRRAHEQRMAELRREVAQTRAAAAGGTLPFWLGWLGRLLLLLGFFAMTLGASGSEQKIFAALFALVLLASLGGLHLDLGANAQLGK